MRILRMILREPFGTVESLDLRLGRILRDDIAAAVAIFEDRRVQQVVDADARGNKIGCGSRSGRRKRVSALR